MHPHGRYTSESSTTTNASGCTEQTELSSVSSGDISSDYAKTSKAQLSQNTEYVDDTRITSAVELNYESQRQNIYYTREKIIPQSGNDRNPILRQESETFSHGCNHAHESAPLLGDYLIREECKRLFKSECAELIKLKKNYKSLRRMFLILSLLCIVLIICTVSVMPVILISFRMENSPVTNDKSPGHGTFSAMEGIFKEFLFQELISQRAKGIIQRHIFCDKCQGSGSNPFYNKDFGDIHELECCHENVFSDFKTFKIKFAEKMQTHFTDMQEHKNRIIFLENELIKLQHNGNNKIDGNKTATSPPGIFERSVLQRRIELNNKLLNKFLNQKRSSLQLKGTVKSNSIDWQQGILNGEVFSSNNNGLIVRSGGTYYMFTNIQFKSDNCTEDEVFEYRILKNRRGHISKIAHMKQSCTAYLHSFAVSLNFQKIIRVEQEETVLFYIDATSQSLSADPWTHVFGIIEI